MFVLNLVRISFEIRDITKYNSKIRQSDVSLSSTMDLRRLNQERGAYENSCWWRRSMHDQSTKGYIGSIFSELLFQLRIFQASWVNMGQLDLLLWYKVTGEVFNWICKSTRGPIVPAFQQLADSSPSYDSPPHLPDLDVPLDALGCLDTHTKVTNFLNWSGENMWGSQSPANTSLAMSTTPP